MFELRSVSVQRNGCSILRAVDASFSPGRLHFIIGANGAGKSTLLSCLAGLLKPSSGRVVYFGRDTSSHSLRALSRVRAFLGQRCAPASFFSVADLVGLGRHPFCEGVLTETDRAIVYEAALQTGVEHLLRRSVHTLSGGEHQRVHFARVLAQCALAEAAPAAKMLLLDEPLNNLDLRFQHRLLGHLSQQAQKTPLCVVAVLHDLNLVAAYASVVFALSTGELLASGTPKEVLTPALLQRLYDVPFSVFSSGSSLHVACESSFPAADASRTARASAMIS